MADSLPYARNFEQFLRSRGNLEIKAPRRNPHPILKTLEYDILLDGVDIGFYVETYSPGNGDVISRGFVPRAKGYSEIWCVNGRLLDGKARELASAPFPFP